MLASQYVTGSLRRNGRAQGITLTSSPLHAALCHSDVQQTQPAVGVDADRLHHPTSRPYPYHLHALGPHVEGSLEVYSGHELECEPSKLTETRARSYGHNEQYFSFPLFSRLYLGPFS